MANTEAAPPGRPTTATIVLQWLNYVLWEGSVIALGTALSLALTYFFVSKTSSSEDTTIYVLATLICLVPIAYAVDHFYRKREATEIVEQSGLGAIVLILNAVVVFICGLGGLIGAVIALLSLIIKTGTLTGTKIALIVALIGAILNGLLFVRILASRLAPRFLKRFPRIIAVLTIVTIILTIAGPFVSSYRNRDDRALESGLPGISSAISSYYSGHDNTLPTSLSQLSLDSEYDNDAKALITSGRVAYKRGSYQTETPPAGTVQPDYIGIGGTINFNSYQLCATYKAAKGDGSTTSEDNYIDTSSHPAGYTCYNQRVTAY